MRVLLPFLALALAARAHAAPLAVVAATPALGGLVEAIGGPDVRVTVLARSDEDPHRTEVRPDLVHAAADADLLLVNGLDLDTRWLPAVLEQSHNTRIQPGARGYLVGAAAIVPQQVPRQVATGARGGEEHPLGNPHYLLDPMNGLRVAALIRDRLAELRPARGDAFRRRFDEFHTRLGARMVGDELAAKYTDVETLVQLAELGRLGQFLESQGDAGLLGGWLGTMAPYRGTRAVGDHDRWPYFARRFGLQVVGHLEPRPGIPPTPGHLTALADMMRARGVRLILAASRDPGQARGLAEQTGATIAFLGNPTGTRDYLSMIDDDVRQVATALGGGTPSTTVPSTTVPPAS